MLRAIFVPLAVLIVVGVATSKAQAQYPSYYKNQWYSKGSGASKYYYTHYFYAPDKYHHAYYYPSKSKRYVYYYNWKTKTYWGRYDLKTELYSLLPENKRQTELDDIKESDFPEPGAPLDKVTIPGSTDTMTPPPKLPE